jgi:GntR family transcriptional regulator, arabinose operon transcriptional repressor
MLKQIDKAVPLPKYYQIGESIKENITGGKYKVGEKLPTCRALSEYFNTTLVTVSNAVKLLESEGYIYKVQGKGMFVKEPQVSKQNDAIFKKVGLLMPTKTDLYQNIADVLIHSLEEFDYEAIPLGTRVNDYKSSIESKEKYVKKYAARGFDSLIINGERHFPYKLLHKYKKYFKQLNFVAHCESALDFPDANIITTDYEQVGYLGGKYLMQQNKKRIAFVSYEKLSPELRKNLGTRQFSSDTEVIKGIKKAMREANVEADIHIIRYNLQKNFQEKVKAEIKDFMEQGDCGIMTMGDNRALMAYHAANDLGLQFGKHCSIVGLFNTPWTEILRPSLTSVSINEREIGRLTAKAVIENWKNKKIKVEPELIVRET